MAKSGTNGKASNSSDIPQGLLPVSPHIVPVVEGTGVEVPPLTVSRGELKLCIRERKPTRLKPVAYNKRNRPMIQMPLSKKTSNDAQQYAPIINSPTAIHGILIR